MEIIQAHADRFTSNPDPVEYERDAREWADVVVEVGTARLNAHGQVAVADIKGTKDVRRIALALAWADGHAVEDTVTVMEPWQWDSYLLDAQKIVDMLTVRGDAPPTLVR